MEDSKEIDTSITTATKLDVDEPGSSVDQKLYRGMIDSLLYLTSSRPGIIFSVGLYARFQESPKEFHLIVVKRILRYLKSTTDMCLWYPKGSNFNLAGYTDVDYAGFLVDRKRTSGMTHFFGSYLVSWATKKKTFVVVSTAEADAISMTKNLVHHKRTEHIDVRYHFLKDNYEKGLITVELCATDKEIADIFTKALSRDNFERNRLELEMIKIT
ncbi:secreted RxLR effector protein 161-like [Nicotiana tomentosiformis]|uniref:secreted RxLR effector protein 161-like n=1 Tax=Nicotiana tomentosiformis TaxID=4098 RepID=UPI00388C7A24